MSSPFPTLIADVDIIRSNIKNMSGKATQNGLEFRPHFKTHQSKKIGRIFREFGVEGITVSSIKMAHYFVEDGWKNITIAFPANVLAAEYYDALSELCELKTLVISEAIVHKLDAQMHHQMGLYIEIDPDYGRSGIPVSEKDKITSLLKTIENSDNFYAAGFYCHAGHTYHAQSRNEVIEIAEKSLDLLSDLKQHFPDIPLCFGDTPSCSVLDDFGPVDQLSPGNFVFYDWMQVQIGSCSPEDIAVSMQCPVIEKFDERQQILIHGGAVHFSKESISPEGYLNFGQLKRDKVHPNNYLAKLSQEHGILQCTAEIYNNLSIGDDVEIYPIHSCLTADLMREYYTADGDKLDHMNGNYNA